MSETLTKEQVIAVCDGIMLGLAPQNEHVLAIRDMALAFLTSRDECHRGGPPPADGPQSRQEGR